MIFSRATYFLFTTPRIFAPPPRLPGKESASASDIVQTCRSTETIGQLCCGTSLHSCTALSNAALCATQGQLEAAATHTVSGIGCPGTQVSIGPLPRAKLTHSTSVVGCSA